ncbi:MAG: hypothetical protein QXU75_07035 [Candidatus Methanomethylicaceae archaeon]
MTKQKWMRWLFQIGYILSFLIIIVFLAKNMEDILKLDWQRMLLPILLNIILYGISLGIQATAWMRLFASISGSTICLSDIKNYYKSHLLRRLPGLPWHIAGRAVAYRESNPRNARSAVAASLIEWIGITFCGLILIAWSRYSWQGLIICLLFFFGSIYLIRRWQKTSHWITLDHFYISDYIYVFLAYEGQWFLASLMLHILMLPLPLVQTPNFIETITIWTTSGIISSLAFFAPMGFGIRELSLVALLAPKIGAVHASLIALIMRALFIVGDLFWGSLVILIPHPNNPKELLNKQTYNDNLIQNQLGEEK